MRIDRWNQKLVVEPLLASLRTHPEEVKYNKGHPYRPIGHLYIPRTNTRITMDASVVYGWYARRHQFVFKPSFIARWRLRRAIKQWEQFNKMILADQPPLWLELTEAKILKEDDAKPTEHASPPKGTSQIQQETGTKEKASSSE